MGGAVNTISKRPAKDFSGELRGLAANYDRYRVEGQVSIPLADNLRIMLGGSKDKQEEGFIKNIGSGNEGGTINRTYFEGQVEAELGEKTTVWLRYSRASWDDTMGVGDRLANIVTPYETTRAFAPIGGLVTSGAFGYGVANPGVNDPYTQNTNTPGYGQLRGNHLLIGQGTYELGRSDEHTSELQSLMRISYDGF